MIIGVLALQGAFREHCALLRRLGVDARDVRTPSDLDAVDALILPGGESTTIDKLLDSSALRPALVARLDAGMPAFGTCAGLIVLADAAVDGTPQQRPLGRIHLLARRNGYGRQLHSFEAPVTLVGDPVPMPGVFIRAPRIVAISDDTVVIATLADGEAVAAANDRIIVAAFHPELTDDDRLHRRFLALVAAPAS